MLHLKLLLFGPPLATASFTAAAGQQFFKATGLKGLLPVSASDLKQFDPYAKKMKHMRELAK